MNNKLYENKSRENKSSDNKLYDLINKIFRPLSSKDKWHIKSLIEQSKNIKQTLETISEIVTNEFIRMKCVTDENRQEFIATKILKFIRQNTMTNKNTMITDKTRIVDLGGGNGNVLQQMNSMLGFAEQKENFICVETKTDWVETYDYSNKNISYMFWDNESLQIEDNSVDTILCMVSLHHMTDSTIETTLKEINRILKPGGMLLVKEHDANEMSKKFIVLEHYLYHIMDSAYQHKVIDPDAYFENCIDNFKSIREWRGLIEDIGGLNRKTTTNRFLDGPFVNDNKNASNLYWEVYTK
jgi:ubiquinone/menaquinone biosynthesis C-methylase UbiE